MSKSSKSGARKASGHTCELDKMSLPNHHEFVKQGLEAFFAEAKKILLEAVMKAEVCDLAGKPNERIKDRAITRWGSETGTAILDGSKSEITRPRLRLCRNLEEGESGEVQLETYAAMNRRELIDGPLTATIAAGVSMRAYGRLLSRVIRAKGVSKSSVSRASIEATKPLLDQFIKRRIDHIQPIVLFFDGVHVGKRQVLACIGVDRSGRKHALGIRVGGTENEIVCRDLIRDLIERGLSTESKCLFVVDGSKALARAIRATFGANSAIQRCQEHKIRDVQAYLPVKLRQTFRMKLQAAYSQKRESTAQKRLDKIRFELSTISVQATNALTEGMYETLTVHRLGVVGQLRKSLGTTNIIESAFSSVRRYMGRVTRFRDEAQRERWIICSLMEAEKHFRMLPGNRQLVELQQSLSTYKSLH